MNIRSISRRSLLQAGTVLAASAVPVIGTGQDQKPIQIVVPFAPGGSGDVFARIVGKSLQERLGRPVIIDSKPGASTSIGSEFVARSAPDGSTILLNSSSLLTLPLAMKSNLRFSVVKDLAPISQAVMLPIVMFANNENDSFKTFAEVVAWAKNNPGKLNVGVTGLGVAGHLAWERLRLMANITGTPVPYGGDGKMVQALLGNQVPVAVGGVAGVTTLAAAGKLRILAVLTAKRVGVLPNVATAAEQGVPGYEAEAWMGFFAPSGTPRETVAKLATEINEILKVPAVRARIIELGMEPVGTTPEVFSGIVSSGLVTWAKVAEDAGVTFK